MNAENQETPEEEQNPEEFVAELVAAEPGLPDEADQHDQVGADVIVDTESAEGSEGEVNAEGEAGEAELTPASPGKPSVVYDPSVLVPTKPTAVQAPPSAFENLAAKGGAIGAIVLGVLSFAGSFITSYAILNSFMGILLGLWGLRSDHQKLAMVGMAICLISAFFCVVEISEWIQTIWPQEEF